MTTQTYQQASQLFLAEAKQELAAGDLPQASEKGWGATAQTLKAVAEQRGWEHSQHRHHQAGDEAERIAAKKRRRQQSPAGVAQQEL